MDDGRPEIECHKCNGEGIRFGYVNCFTCDGKGWRPMTDDEWDDWSADRFSDACESEPPLSAEEMHERAWKQKRELKR